MAKSRETYNKKEKEKKRLKKKQDKVEKKEARKSNKEESDSMVLAYVDENGNITSTPPDPSKKKVINHENISIGVSKQEDLSPEDLVRAGTVTFFNESKGYGFIKDHDSQDSIFVHINGLVDAVKEHDKVTYEVENTPRGPNAVGVKLKK